MKAKHCSSERRCRLTPTFVTIFVAQSLIGHIRPVIAIGSFPTSPMIPSDRCCRRDRIAEIPLVEGVAFLALEPQNIFRSSVLRYHLPTIVVVSDRLWHPPKLDQRLG